MRYWLHVALTPSQVERLRDIAPGRYLATEDAVEKRLWESISDACVDLAKEIDKDAKEAAAAPKVECPLCGRKIKETRRRIAPHKCPHGTRCEALHLHGRGDEPSCRECRPHAKKIAARRASEEPVTSGASAELVDEDGAHGSDPDA